jgi:hypothetical protein
MNAPVEYIFARTDDGAFTVSKFAGGTEPEEVYKVKYSKQQDDCECMAWWKKIRPCKHGRMIAAWLEAGEPEAGEYVCLGKGKDWVFRLKPQTL